MVQSTHHHRPTLKQVRAYSSQTIRFKPEQVKVTFLPNPEDPTLGRIGIEATGPWLETILWEVPLMACLSELFFTTVDTDWSYDGQEGSPPQPRLRLMQLGFTRNE